MFHNVIERSFTERIGAKNDNRDAYVKKTSKLHCYKTFMSQNVYFYIHELH
jgi:hypothetical protein